MKSKHQKSKYRTNYVKSQEQIKKYIPNTPLVFNIKKKKSMIKTYAPIKKNTGKIRHSTPAAQEWYNSIYSFNSNYVKSLPVLDKSLHNLLKNYSNMWPKHIALKKKPKLLNKLIKLRPKLKPKKKWLLKRKNEIKPLKLYKRSSLNKVFLGKGNLKHTSNKVIVTLHTYNRKKIHLLKKIRILIFKFFLTKIPLVRWTTLIEEKVPGTENKIIQVKMKGKKKDQKHRNYPTKFITVKLTEKFWFKRVLLYNRRLTLGEYLNSSYNFFKWTWPNIDLALPNKFIRQSILPLNLIKKAERIRKNRRSKRKKASFKTLHTSFFNLISYTLLKVKSTTRRLDIILNYYNYLSELVENKILNDHEKLLIFTSKANKFNVYKYRTSRFVLTKFKEKKLYLQSLLKFAWLLYINDVKFKHPLLVSRLKYLVSSLYDKEVEFNLVELKKLHLSSDIYTQLVALKLKKKNNKLYRVLKWSLLKIKKLKLPNVRLASEKRSKFNEDEYLANKIRNKYISSMFILRKKKHSKTDSLNNLLSGLYHSTRELGDDFKNMWSTNKSRFNLAKLVISETKHNKLSGIRVEAKGRLTRRFTAQRSVFKMRYKGGLKNVDSSFRGLSTIMLRGFFKSNVQYSIVQSKNRNGAYGVKGWVGSK